MSCYKLNGKTIALTVVLMGCQYSAHADSDIDPQEAFTAIYNTNHWNCAESISGGGSTLKATNTLRIELPKLLKKLGVRTLLDAPCGDFNWMKDTDLGIDAYIGADIVPAMVESNQQLYSSPTRAFMQLDLTKDELPKVDAIFCRECIQHLSMKHVYDLLRNCKQSGATYLLVTTHTKHKVNRDCDTGGSRRVNLELAPYNSPKPLYLLNEKHRDKYNGNLKTSMFRVKG